MLESLIAFAIFVGVVRYVWVSMRRDVLEDVDTDIAQALDSIRDAHPVEGRESDFAPLASADAEVSRRPRVRAGTLPTINQGTK